MAGLGVPTMVMGAAGHPLAPHRMGPLAIEQGRSRLSLRLGVVERFYGTAASGRPTTGVLSTTGCGQQACRTEGHGDQQGRYR